MGDGVRRRVCGAALAAILLALVAGARAEDRGREQLPEPPPILVAPAAGAKPALGAAQRPAAPDNCVDVEIADEHSYGCLNADLKRRAESVPPSLNLPPIDARSPDVKTGVFSETAVQQQFGKNFALNGRARSSTAGAGGRL
jgi:hypothetical protein